MPRRELKHPHQVEDWLVELSQQLTQPGRMILIGSGTHFNVASPNRYLRTAWTLIQSLILMKSRVSATTH